MDEVKALEYTTVKVPYEMLNKRFRSCQKVIDREVSHVVNTCTLLENSVKSNSPVEYPAALISNIDQSMKSLSSKASECVESQKSVALTIKTRTKHLRSFVALEGIPTDAEDCSCAVGMEDCVNEKTLSDWKQTRMNRLIAEYFLMNGYYESARLLIEATDIGDLTNVEVFTTARTVESALRNKNSSPCLSWCAENRSKLRKIKSTLEFNLRKQGFVELVRLDLKLEALNYAKSYIFNAMTDHTQYKELEELSGILAYIPENFESSPYKSYFEETRWNDLAEQFKSDNYKVHCITSTPIFTQVFSTGLTAIKTSSCYKPSEFKEDCPTCDETLKKIALGLPTAPLSQSRVICRISGDVMNEHNPPLMLPNGNAYSTNALLAIAHKNAGRVTCPRTNQEFSISDCVKVYLM